MGKFVTGTVFGIGVLGTILTAYNVGLKKGRRQTLQIVDERLIKPVMELMDIKEESENNEE